MIGLRRYGTLVTMVLSAAWFGHDPSYEPAIVFLAALCGFVGPDLIARRRRRQAKEQPEKSQDGSLLLPRPRLMDHTRPESLENVGVRVLRSPRGTISVWVYLDQQGRGIRELDNNRYLFSSATDLKMPYKNVFAFALGPTKFHADLAWTLSIANGKGVNKSWSYPDGGEFDVGWHLILACWDHSAPLLKMIIDHKTVISETGYLNWWPQKYPDRAYIGCWPNRADCHWANTYLSRLRMVPRFVEESWITDELSKKPDDPKV